MEDSIKAAVQREIETVLLNTLAPDSRWMWARKMGVIVPVRPVAIAETEEPNLAVRYTAVEVGLERN